MSATTFVNQAEANRANAQHSTGPKTDEGKRKSSLNALRHGLTGQIVVMPSEDLAAYQLHLKSFRDHLQPEGPIEAHLVQSLADTAWRLNRVAALETNLLTLGVTRETSFVADALEKVQQALAIAASLESQTKALSNLSMHTQRLSRQFERVERHLRELQDLRRRAAAIGKQNKTIENPSAPAGMASFFQASESSPATASAPAPNPPQEPAAAASVVTKP